MYNFRNQKGEEVFLIKNIIKMLLVAVFAMAAFLVIPKQSAFAFADAPTTVTATSGPGIGQITLTWNQTGTVRRYALIFGNSSNSYNMGLLNFPSDVRSLTVNDMVSGHRYFLRIWAYDDPNGAATASPEVSAVAK